MPERTSNPYRRDRSVIGGMARHCAWDQGYAAARADRAAWLASDEAVERVADAILWNIHGHTTESWAARPDWQHHAYREVARAVLTALRGDGNA